MKNRFISSLIVLPLMASAQIDIGKIDVCSHYTVTLMFATDIEFVIFGNNPMIDIVDDMPEYENYAIFQRGKTLILKANKDKIPSTSINVKTMDGTLFYGFIENRDNTTLFYDLTKKTPVTAQTPLVADAAETKQGTKTGAEKIDDFEKKLEHVSQRH